MLLVYLGTLAPSVTFWDAGEFIAAARVLGFLPFATATNLASATCTAIAIGIATLCLARAIESPWPAVAAGITAGAMSSVWLNATETEVYAASLCLAVLAIAAGDVAG